MPRPSKGARIWFDKSAGQWFIRDGKSKRSTGCSFSERKGAEEALATYIATRYVPPTDSRASKLLVADILTYYSREIAVMHKSQAASYAIGALVGWWKARPLSDVKRSTCKQYVDARTKQPRAQAKTDKAKARKVSAETARRELNVLRAAIRAYHEETPLDALPVVTLPPPSPARNRWMRRDEVARMIRAARQMGRESKRSDDKEAATALIRFILVAVYTGTRAGAVRRLGWQSNPLGGWVDIEGGVIHRRSEGEVESKKRKPPVRIPDRLKGSMHRWRTKDMAAVTPVPFVVHYRGKPVKAQRKTWNEARRRAKLGDDVTPHILKHTAVTWMMQAGSDPWEVSDYIGISLQMLQDVYGHHHPDFQKGVTSRVGRK